MTRFDKLMLAGAGMEEKERVKCIQALMLDERFGGLLGWLRERREEWSRAANMQTLAGSHGTLAHANGSAFAMDALLDELRGIEPNRKKRGLSPTEGNEENEGG